MSVAASGAITGICQNEACARNQLSENHLKPRSGRHGLSFCVISMRFSAVPTTVEMLGAKSWGFLREVLRMAFRILLADDHEVVRRGLFAILQNKSEWEVCGEAKDGIDAVEKAKRLKPDAVIIDIGMPNLNGLDATRQIVDALPQTKVLVLTLYDSDDMIQQVLNAGARGFLLKSDAGRNLVAAVEALRRSGTYFTSKVAEMVRDGYLRRNTEPALLASKRTRLTFRERQLVQLLAEGKSTRQAALALGMSVKTAETHRSNVMRKLQLHSISELVLYAVRNSIVQIAQAQN